MANKRKIKNIEASPPRTTLSSGGGSRPTNFGYITFPTGLESSDGGDYMTIKVYDTDANDMVNKGIEPILKQINNLQDKAYKEATSMGTDYKALWNSFGTSTFANKKLDATYFGSLNLPFPNNLKENFSHSYAEQPGWAAGGGMSGALAGSVAGKATGVTGGETTGAILGALGGGMAVGGLQKLEGMSAKVSMATGTQAYKFYENKINMYNNSAFRTIDLQWLLFPQNKTEVTNLERIIKTLKQYSSAQSLAGKMLVRSPCFFKLDFQNDDINKALQFNEVNVTSINVEYSPGGNMERHEDGSPKSISLSIGFTDREPKLYEDWDELVEDKPSQQSAANC